VCFGLDGAASLYSHDDDGARHTQTDVWQIEKQNDAPVYPDASITLPPTQQG